MNARQAYKANHSDIRAFGRFAKSPEERAARIAEACRERRWWLDAPHATSGVGALRALNGSMTVDVLALLGPTLAGAPLAALRSASHLRRLSYRFYFSGGKLPR